MCFGMNREVVDDRDSVSSSEDEANTKILQTPSVGPTLPTQRVTNVGVKLEQLNFPSKLHRILSTPEFNDIICWLPHGRSWRVQQRPRFEKEVLPLFFDHGKYSSFARQINGWGFRRVASGRDFNSFYHELFLRDEPNLCLQMKRPSSAELARRKKEGPDSPPNFYLMSNASNASSRTTDQGPPTQDSPQINPTTADDYMHNLRVRISRRSRREQEAILRLELALLDRQKQQVLDQLQRLNLSRGSSAARQLSLPVPVEQQLLQQPLNLAAPTAAVSQPTDILTQRALLQLYLQGYIN